MIDQRDAAVLAAVAEQQRRSFAAWHPREHSYLVRGRLVSDSTLADRARSLERRLLLWVKPTGLAALKGYVLSPQGELALQDWPGEHAWPETRIAR